MIVKITKYERILKVLFEYYRNKSRYKVIYKSLFILLSYILHYKCSYLHFADTLFEYCKITCT